MQAAKKYAGSGIALRRPANRASAETATVNRGRVIAWGSQQSAQREEEEAPCPALRGSLPTCWNL